MSQELIFNARSRSLLTREPKEYEVRWHPGITAAIVCDMWAEHWCKNAERRSKELVPRMNRLLKELRHRVVQIIHAPSGGVDNYEELLARVKGRKAAPVPTTVEIKDRRFGIYEKELPIDWSDGGCDCTPQCTPRRERDRRQMKEIEINPYDIIAHEAEVYYVMKERGITNVLIMGVHLNICVLGRPFGIRQMNMLGQNVMFVRDLTDTMYNPRMPPYVSHHEGTRLVVEHIEQFHCPSITSDQLIGGKPFEFSDAS